MVTPSWRNLEDKCPSLDERAQKFIHKPCRLKRILCEISQHNFITIFMSRSVNPFNFENVKFLKAVFYPRKCGVSETLLMKITQTKARFNNLFTLTISGYTKIHHWIRRCKQQYEMSPCVYHNTVLLERRKRGASITNKNNCNPRYDLLR